MQRVLCWRLYSGWLVATWHNRGAYLSCSERVESPYLEGLLQMEVSSGYLQTGELEIFRYFRATGGNVMHRLL